MSLLKFLKCSILNLALLAAAVVFVVAGCGKTEGDFHDYANPNAIYNGSIYEFLESQNGLYDSMLYVIDRTTGIKELLQKGDVTLFGVSNQSFDLALENLNEFRKVQSKPPLYLHQADSVQLDTLIRRYILPAPVLTDSIKDYYDGVWLPSYATSDSDRYEMHLKYQRGNASGYTNGGPQQIIYSDPKNSQFERYWIKTTTSSVNIRTKNGVVHILSPGHEFGFGEFTERINK